MTFVFWAALGLVVFVVGPVVAHLLRRGHAEEREFPGAALVPPRRSTARQRSRVEDWTLLALRSALIVGLAVLGAMPLVRCQRLSVARSSGGSVALALVLDDSLSMRFRVGGKERWSTARDGADELLRSVRDGDSIAIVLAGRPARVALAPTTDVAAARRTLRELSPSDRSTDLAAAVTLARTALRGLPQKDHRVFVLSDLAGETLPEGSPPASAPLATLGARAPDCAVTSAERQGSRVTVALACGAEEASGGRVVEIVLSSPPKAAAGPDAGARAVKEGDVVGRADVARRAGEQSVVIEVGAVRATLDARLLGTDACAHDDLAPVSDEPAARKVAVVADPRTAAAKTGGPTVLEQAVDALALGWSVQPLPTTPDDDQALAFAGALVVDDPRGFSPEARTAITHFIEQGGVAIAMLGRRAATPPLGWTLEPFARGAARWEPAAGLSVDPSGVPFLEPERSSLAGIGREGRIRLDGMEIEGARVSARWSDGIPWLLERRLGRGLCFTLGLPASPEESELPLRPAFLAFLDHVLHQADLRKGTRRSVAGTAWAFAGTREVTIEGPEGPVPVTTVQSEESCSESPDTLCAQTFPEAIGALRGRYRVRLDGQDETRIVTVDPAEVLAEPLPAPKSAPEAQGGEAATVGASREVAWLLLAIFAAELLVRVFRRVLVRRAW